MHIVLHFSLHHYDTFQGHTDPDIFSKISIISLSLDSAPSNPRSFPSALKLFYHILSYAHVSVLRISLRLTYLSH